jgi:hypothetical protein
MATLGRKGELYVTRFRFQGKECKRSLKTTWLADTRAAMHGIERVVHGLTTGLLHIPSGVDPGDYIVSGGSLKGPAKPRRRVPPQTDLIDGYLGSLSHKAASSVIH